MEVYRIKHNYRYIIYKIRNDYCLVDLYDHWWLTILFPFLGWFLYHKAYLLDNDDLQKFNMISKRKLSSLSVGGISLLIAPLIVSLWDYAVYISNIMNNDKLLHALILVIFTLFCIHIYICDAINWKLINIKILFVLKCFHAHLLFTYPDLQHIWQC